ncbi:MAG: hypothetical protein IPH04_13925, partial [Saprospirales bacterium]|nr:hypothetical protein [Saprospirales bacterium]
MLGYYAFILIAEERLSRKVLGLAGALICLSSVYLNAGSPSELKGFYYFVTIISMFILSIFLKYSNITFPKIATNIGLSSYSLYLIHVPIGVLIFGRQKGFDISENPALHFLVDTAIVAILALVSFLVFKY